MTRSTRFFHRSRLSAWALWGGLLVALSGCGGDDMERRYSASGTVTYKGEPVDHGDIVFSPIDAAKGRAASAIIDKGSFALTTVSDRDGALPGQYRVTVTSKDVDLSAIKPAPGRSAVNPAIIGKAMRDAKNLVPKKYASSQTSPLTAEVKEQSNSFTFDLAD